MAKALPGTVEDTTMTVREAELISNAKKPLEYNAEPDDEIVIVSDTAMDERVWSTLTKAARAMDHEPTLILMPQAEYSYAEPPEPVASAMMGADLVLMATSKGLAHSDAAGEVIAAGKKVVLMSELSGDTLASGAADADYDEILATGLRIEERMNAGDRIEMTGPGGTDIAADISGQWGAVKAARAIVERDKPDYPAGHAKIAAFPDGEVPITPNAGTTNGPIVWDTTMHEIGTIDEPIRAEVEDGYVTEITGGREAAHLREFLDGFDDPNVYNIGELSVNINPGAGITGRLREDKKAAGYLHIAVGSGGDVEAPVHIDGVLEAGTVTIDGDPVISDGEIVV